MRPAAVMLMMMLVLVEEEAEATGQAAIDDAAAALLQSLGIMLFQNGVDDLLSCLKELNGKRLAKL